MSDADVQKLADHVHIDNFRNNKTINLASYAKYVTEPNTEPFIRNGVTKTDWPDAYTPELIERARTWIANGLAGCDIEFPGFKYN